jgi:hypothetical protein
VKALNVPLRDVGILARLRDTLSGVGFVDVAVAGRKPILRSKSLPVSQTRTGAASMSRVRRQISRSGSAISCSTVSWSTGRLLADSLALRAVADVPVDVSLFNMRVRNDSIKGR